MTADELFQAGRLSEAIDAQTAEVKKAPTDPDARFMLFVLLCYAGELERADKALDVIASRDQQAQSGALVYYSLLAAELERRNVYEGTARPTLPPDSPAWATLRVEALELLRRGDAAGAEAVLDRAADETPALSGKQNGEAFEGIRDYDDVLGTVLEIFAGGRYIWMPMSHVRSLHFTSPASALDLLWRPAKLEDASGIAADVHLPALYQPSYKHADDQIRVGRSTEWIEHGDLYTGVGQHVLLSVRGGERCEDSLLELSSLELASAA